MVTHSRTPQRPGSLRALNGPEPVRVRLEGSRAEGQGSRGPATRNLQPLVYDPLPPAAVYVGRRWMRVREVLDAWRIDDEWWREQPISRLYYRVLLEDGMALTLFHDLLSGRWSRQRAGGEPATEVAAPSRAIL